MDRGRINDISWFEAHRADYETLVLGPAKEFIMEFGHALMELLLNWLVDLR